VSSPAERAGLDRAAERLLRDLAPQVIGAVVRRCGDFAAAEDAVQEALLAAAAQWPRDGVPSNPGGWLFHVASRRLQDQRRSDEARRRREAEAIDHASVEARAVAPAESAAELDRDDALILLFMCCHPALTPATAIALTLRAVGGLTTAEIATAFMVPELTMAQRISRAKQKIRSSDVPFELPSPAEQEQRLRSVLHVLYLMFNEGYASSAGVLLQRVELSAEAIRLTRELHRMRPDEPEVAGLLALMLLTDARRAARTGGHGQLIPLDEQDRTRWDRAAIDEGVALVTAALARGGVGPYRIQAAIAALHDEAASTAETDWPQILALYGVLETLSDNPMVTLNRAIAAAMVHGPAAALEMLRPLDADARTAGHYRLDAVRAHLHEMAGDLDSASALYGAAAARTASAPERDYLTMKAARLTHRSHTAAGTSRGR
jgi:RNA polymerase sigma factor (sigma-70 family)